MPSSIAINVLLLLSVVISVALGASNVIVRATREVEENIPNCSQYAEAVREKMNEEFLANGYGNDRRDLQTILDKNLNCAQFCHQLRVLPGYCFVFSGGTCGVQSRRLQGRALMTEEQHGQCLDQQRMMLQSLVQAALYVDMPFECREHYWSSWQTECFTADDLPPTVPTSTPPPTAATTAPPTAVPASD